MTPVTLSWAGPTRHNPACTVGISATTLGRFNGFSRLLVNMSSLTTAFPSSLMQLHSSLCHLTYTSYLWVSVCQLAPKKTALLVPKPHHFVVDISITTPSRPIPRLVFLCCCPCCVPAWLFFQKEKEERKRLAKTRHPSRWQKKI